MVVCNGKGRTRKVTVGAGTIPVSAPRVNDRRTDQDGERRRFTSRILPPYMRRSPKVAEVLPVLYLRGLSTGDFREALAVLLGDHAAGLSAMDGASFPRAPGGGGRSGGRIRRRGHGLHDPQLPVIPRSRGGTVEVQTLWRGGRRDLRPMLEL